LRVVTYGLSQVERVVAKETRKDGIWYLVKWEGLPYSEATWEQETDVNVSNVVININSPQIY